MIIKTQRKRKWKTMRYGKIKHTFYKMVYIKIIWIFVVWYRRFIRRIRTIFGIWPLASPYTHFQNRNILQRQREGDILCCHIIWHIVYGICYSLVQKLIIWYSLVSVYKVQGSGEFNPYIYTDRNSEQSISKEVTVHNRVRMVLSLPFFFLEHKFYSPPYADFVAIFCIWNDAASN